MIRVGSIGTSSITHRTVAASKAVAGLAFTAASSRDETKAAALASELGLEQAFGSVEALLASPDVDAVYIATPNAIHASQVRAALEAGKNVFVEKPAVGTAAEWNELCALARSRGLVLLENMRTAYDPVMVRIADLLGTLGEPRQAAFHFSQRSARYDQVLAGERPAIFDPALGGGALSDLGVYLTHPVARLLGRPDAVAASAVRLATGADGGGAALLTYPGMVAQLTWSKITAGRLPSSIEGELGTLTFNHMTELETLSVDYLDGRQVRERPEREADNITYSLRRFADLVATSGDAAPDQGWTFGSLDLMERIREAL